jgi:uncharacterized protein (TIGR02117 family)
MLLLAVAAAGCGSRAAVVWPPAQDHLLAPDHLKDVWVARRGWHTYIAVARADVDPAVWPESRDLGDVAYLEVGWGDRDFFPKTRPSVWDALDPVVRRTPAALHVGGFDRPPAEAFADSDVVHLRVSAEGFTRLTRFVHEHYVRDAAGAPVRLQPGVQPRSWFYLAEGCYHVLTNSNNWTLRALRAAGAPVVPWRALTAGNAIEQAERLGERVDGGRPVGR